MKQHFAVIVQRTSKWDNSTPPEQQPGFPDHLAYMGGLEKSGAIALAGLMTSTNDVLFVFLAESEDEVIKTARAACTMAYQSEAPVAVLLTQKLLGAKAFSTE